MGRSIEIYRKKLENTQEAVFFVFEDSLRGRIFECSGKNVASVNDKESLAIDLSSLSPGNVTSFTLCKF